jgi:hypothetical protein
MSKSRNTALGLSSSARMTKSSGQPFKVHSLSAASMVMLYW